MLRGGVQSIAADVAGGRLGRALKKDHPDRFSIRKSGTCPNLLTTNQSLARLLCRRGHPWPRYQAVFNSLIGERGHAVIFPMAEAADLGHPTVENPDFVVIFSMNIAAPAARKPCA